MTEPSPPAPGEAGSDPAAVVPARPGLGRWRLAALAVYLVVVAVVWKRTGVPLERLQVLGWVGGALLIATTGRPRGGFVAVVRDWVPIAAVLSVYDLSRGMADGLGMPVLRSSLVRAEQVVTGPFLPGDAVPTVWAQDRLGPFTGPARWWEVPISLVYLSHFVVPFAVLGVLWVRDRPVFRSYRDSLLVVTGLGLATYVLLPAAPPWMASRDGLIGPVRRVVLRGMDPFGLDLGTTLVTYGPRYGNAVAALPSLHAGWSTMSVLFLARRMRRRWWPLLALYPLTMGVALVVSGEHYVVDIVLGAVYAAVAVLVVARRDARRQPGSEPVPPGAAGGPPQSSVPAR
jgi:membrane-associated phospholipid phosphatase